MPDGSGIFTNDQTNRGAVPDILDLVTNLEAPLYPASSWFPYGETPEQPETTFYMNGAESVNHRGTPEGQDITNFGISRPVEYKARAQFFEDAWKVSDQSSKWTVKGRGKMAEIAYQKAMALGRLKKKQHLRLLSSVDATAEGVSGAEFNGTAGIFAYARTGATGYHVIPEGFRPASAQVLAGANLSAFDEDAFLGMIKAVYDKRKQKIMWTGFVGSSMKGNFRLWQAYQKDISGRTPIRSANLDDSAKAVILAQVNYLSCDYGEVDLVLEPWLLYTEGAAGTPSVAADATNYSGCFLDRKCVKLAYVMKPKEVPLVDGGGGERGGWKSGLELRNLLPNAHGFATYQAA